MNKPVAIVTGGAGFIGSHMVDLLVNEGYRVRIIDNLIGGRIENLNDHSSNSFVEFEQWDIRNLTTNNNIFKDVKLIFHFAGIGDIVPSIEKPIEYMSINVQGTANILDCARHSKIDKFIYAASSSCYGLASTPTTENHPIKPMYPYALSKYFGEQTALHWNKVYGMPVNSIRIFNAYGIRSRTSGAYGAVFGVFLKQKLENKPFTVVGDGTQTRDFLYVTDVVRAFFCAGLTDHIGEVYNLGAGKPQSINYLVKLLGGKKKYIPKRPGEPDCTWANISKITNHLSWKPKVSFEKGVEEIKENILYWKDAPLWDTSSIKKATDTWFRYMKGREEQS